MNAALLLAENPSKGHKARITEEIIEEMLCLQGKELREQSSDAQTDDADTNEAIALRNLREKMLLQ